MRWHAAREQAAMYKELRPLALPCLQAAVSAFNSWARVDLPGVGPLKSTAFALRVRDLIRGRQFGTEVSSSRVAGAGST